jgi:hypothetical protein
VRAEILRPVLLLFWTVWLAWFLWAQFRAWPLEFLKLQWHVLLFLFVASSVLALVV